jgi:hypothetical protein
MIGSQSTIVSGMIYSLPFSSQAILDKMYDEALRMITSMNKYAVMAKAHTFKELGEQFLATNEIQLLGGINVIMSEKDPNWNTGDCYKCRRDLVKLGCPVALVRLRSGKPVYCCVPCQELTARIEARRIELRDAMRPNK